MNIFVYSDESGVLDKAHNDIFAYDVARKFGVNVPEFYAELARAFLMDKDGHGPEEKLCAYYRCIVKQNR